MKKRLVAITACTTLAFLTSAFAQNFEFTAHVGGQINGGLDLATSLFHRFEVANGVNYGVAAGYLLGEHAGVEFMWNQNKADVRAQPFGGFSSIKLFTMTQNQYLGNFLFHFTPREDKLRPFLLAGLGATALDPDVHGVSGTTRFVYALGAGAKYNVSNHFGLRGQFKWSPTYITSTNSGYWCDPFWGGCWVIGNSHYLHELDITGGITFRFGGPPTPTH
jgi:opacity protein-like surface antigen